MNRIPACLLVAVIFLSSNAFSQAGLDDLTLKKSLNYGKSVAVFGGSVSVIPPSDSAKILWKKYLGMTITNYGVPGAGFSSLQGKSLQQQVLLITGQFQSVVGHGNLRRSAAFRSGLPAT